MRARAHNLVPLVACLLGASALSGCLERKLKPLNPCLVSGVVAEITVDNVEKVDLLFMVDNSKSMREEQASLREQFPKLIEVLTTGMRPNGTMFPPAKDLHLGVVSSDMGLANIPDVDGCGKNDGLGDDGILLNTPSPEVANCEVSYPRFLSFRAGIDDPLKTANDFACIASLGTGGCGFEQQLESVLKALWPSVDVDPETGYPIEPNRIRFLGDENGLTLGHGDQVNLGFLRNDPAEGLSLIAIIVVTDEEDCSSADTSHFIPDRYLPEGHPNKGQELNLRCFYNKANLYPLTRYIDGLKALRPQNPNLVIFGAIAGVPQDLVEPADYDAVDWKDDAARDAFYDAIMSDPRMQEVVDPNRTPEEGANLYTSCAVEGRGAAYPPRRIVEVARGFGKNGAVFSICQHDLGPAVDAIIDIIAEQLGSVCLPRPLVRNSEGLVGCDVVWELPPPSSALAMTPTTCGAPGFEFLLPVGSDRQSTTARGGAVCRVAQMPVLDNTVMPLERDGQTFSEGWYYDDFTAEVQECAGETKQRVAFTTRATPPSGVTVKLECLNETQRLAHTRNDLAANVEQPSIGDPCERVMRNGSELRGDAACAVHLTDGSMDASMFCHPKEKVCVLSCATTIDCPDAWVCDERLETLAATAGTMHTNGSPICVNPTCGDSND